MRTVVKKYIKIAGKILVSGTLIYFLVKNINWAEVMQYFFAVHPLFLFLSVGFYICGLVISAHKWRILASHLSFVRDFHFYMQTYVFGTLLNNFFPSFVGGDAYRIFALGKQDGRLKDASATIVADRVSGLIGSIVLAIFCGALNIQYVIHNTILMWMFFGLVGVVIIFCMVATFFHTSFIQCVVRFFPLALRTYVDVLARFRERYISIQIFLYSIFFTFIGVACANYALFLAMDIHVPFINYVGVIFLASIIAAVPVSMGNIGTKEWAYIFLFGLFGIPSSAVIAVALLSRALQMVVSFGSLPGYFREKQSHKTCCTNE